jgi:hypothetical protein
MEVKEDEEEITARTIGSVRAAALFGLAPILVPILDEYQVVLLAESRASAAGQTQKTIDPKES